MRRWLVLPVVTLAVLAARPVGAEDPKTYTIPARETWKAGDVVSRKQADKKVTKTVVKGPDGAVMQEGGGEEITAFECTFKVLEVSAEGAYTKALVHFTSWSHKVGEAEDASLQEKHVEVSGVGAARTVKIVTPGADVSPEAIEWLEGEFGKGTAKEEAIRAALTPTKPIAIGGTSDIEPAALAKAFDDERMTVVADKSSAKVTLKDVKDGVSSMDVLVDCQTGPVNTPGGKFEWKDGGRLSMRLEDTRALDAGSHGSTAKKWGGLKGVMVSAEGITVDFELEAESEELVKAGGEMPAVPAAGGMK